MKFLEVEDGLGGHIDASYRRRVEQEIDSAKTEREIVPFFKENFILVRNAFAEAWNYAGVGWEFQPGSDYRPDFVVLTAKSGAWEAHFVEFESPKASLYIKNGEPAKALRAAKKQVDDWDNWNRKNKPYLRKLLAKPVAMDLPSLTSGGYLLASDALKDPDVYLSSCYHVVIGRRRSLSPADVERKESQSRSQTWGSPEIVTYDRFIDIAKHLANSTMDVTRD